MSNTQPPAQFDWATELSDAQGQVTLSEQEAHEIGARLRASHGQAPAGAAPAAVAGPSEAVKFTDQSTAAPVEKARRYLAAMGDQRTNSAYFYDDGYPRRESAQDALATLAVLEQLAAAPTTQPAPQQEPVEMPAAIEQMATGRYKVVPSHESMFHRWAVVAGTGAQQLYLGREVECQNMARKFAGAFLDGVYVALRNAAPQPSPAVQGDALDTMRLDWLDADESRCVFRLGKSWYTRPSYGLPYRKRASLREAIDAARAAQEGASHEQ